MDAYQQNDNQQDNYSNQVPGVGSAGGVGSQQQLGFIPHYDDDVAA